MAICNYQTELGTVTTSVGEGYCVMSVPDISDLTCESGHITATPVIMGNLVGFDGFSYTSDYNATFLGGSPTCAAATHTITQGNQQIPNGFVNQWHFRYFRVTDPLGNAFGYSTWHNGSFNPPNSGLTTSAAVPIDTLIHGATNYASAMT